MPNSPTAYLLEQLGRAIPAKGSARGQTWIALFGEGPAEVDALLETAGPYIERAKLGYGSSLLLSWEALTRVTAALRRAGIICYPGGTLVEMALRAGKLAAMLDWSAKAGFDGIEVCDGVIEMSDQQRADTIGAAVCAGFRVSTVVQEAIRKPVVEIVPLAERIARCKADLAAGADFAHIVFQALMRGETPSDVVGPIKRDQALQLVEQVGADKLVFEAMTGDDQLKFIRMLGKNVHLGHVAPRTVMTLAAQRTAFAYETLWSEVWGRPHWS